MCFSYFDVHWRYKAACLFNSRPISRPSRDVFLAHCEEVAEKSLVG